MRKSIAIFLVGFLAISMMVGCNKKEKVDNQEETTKKVEEIVDNNEDSKIKEEEIFEELFNHENVVSIQVDISEEELNKLQEDYIKYDHLNSKSPIYRKADKVIISIGDEVYEIEEVGIRLKGNTSRVAMFDEKTGNFNLSHYRLSFNETFDDENYYGEDAKVWDSVAERDERKNRTFATLESLEIKWNKNYDNTHVREIYAYDMFREFGVLSQHVTLCSLGMNGENYGVVNIYEPVDEIFIAKNFNEEEAKGDLYKCGWIYKPANYVDGEVTYGIADKDEGKEFNYNLKTNKKTSEHTDLKNLLATVGKEDITKEEFENVVDADYLAKFMAVSYFTGNPDDYRNNYNNHYLYITSSSKKAILIPFDYDRCLGITYSWNPDGTGMTRVSPFSEYAEAMCTEQNNPIIREAIIDQKYIYEKYVEELKNIRNSEWVTVEKFEEYYNTAKENYEELVTPTIDFANVYEDQFGFSLAGDSYIEGADYANMSFEKYIKDLLTYFDSEVFAN